MPRDTAADGRNILRGLALLACFRAEGLTRFEATPRAFVASLTPWLAFLLVGGVMLALHGRVVEGATDSAVLLTSLLLPAVVSQALSAFWKRDALWLRYVTAYTWCEWLMLVAYAVSLLLASFCVAAGMPARIAPIVLLSAVGVYWLGLHFFLARAALALSRTRAALVVAAVILSYAALLAVGRGVGGYAGAMFGA